MPQPQINVLCPSDPPTEFMLLVEDILAFSQKILTQIWLLQEEFSSSMQYKEILGIPTAIQLHKKLIFIV